LRDANGDVEAIKKRIDSLERYAKQCRITGDLEEYRETQEEINNLKNQIEEIRKGTKDSTGAFKTGESESKDEDIVSGFKNQFIQSFRNELNAAIDRGDKEDIKRRVDNLISAMTNDSKTTKDGIVNGQKIIQVELRDPDNSLEKFLKLLRDMANPGHSFEVVLDPDGDCSGVLFFDGDGSFKISHIKSKDAGDVDFTIDNIGKHNDVEDEDYNQNELARGIKVEMEHTDSYYVAKAIAKDHLSEIPDYYERLSKMESEGRKSNNA